MYLLSFCYQIPQGFFLQLVCVIFEVKNCFRSVKKILLCFLVAIVISCTSDNSGVLGELVVEDNLGSDVIEIGEVNIVGNVWDITGDLNNGMVRLAGGSLFCSKNTCHGTVKDRVLFVDKETGNIHIGFSVIDL